MFKNKKFIIFGEVIAVTTEAITACLEAAGVKEEDIILSSFECLG